MTTKRKKDVEKPPSQESEDSMSQALADLGMLEQGMTLQDKRDLLNAVRLSKKSAEAEEEGRKTKDKDKKIWSPNTSPKKHVPYSALSNVEYESSRPNEVDMKIDDFPSLSSSIIRSNAHNFSDYKEHPLSVNPGAYLGSRNASHSVSSDAQLKLVLDSSLNPCTNVNSKETEGEGDTIDPVGNQDKCKDNENAVLQKEGLDLSDNSELEVVPPYVKHKQNDCNGLKKKKDDKERNIDVFSHSTGSSNGNFSRRNVKRNQERVPFYFVPEGMDLRNYVAYFKCYVNEYYKKLSDIQKNNIEHLEWGPPITLEMSSTFTNIRSCLTDANGDSASKRYNFRDRCPKPKLVDFTSENSEDAEEEESNDEDIFVPRHKKLPGIKLSAKRKNTSNDSMSTKKEKKEFLPKKSQDDVSVEDDDQQDIQNGDNPEKIISKAKGATPSRKRTRKPRSKLLQLQNEISEDINSYVPNEAITSIIEPDIVIAEGASMESTAAQLDDVIDHSSPLGVKQRRVQRVNRRKSEPRKNPDIVIVDDVKSVQSEVVEGVRCPICWNTFPAPDIEEHASECNQYSPDNNSSSKM